MDGHDVATIVAAASVPSFASLPGATAGDEVPGSKATVAGPAYVPASRAFGASPSWAAAACRPAAIACDADFPFQAFHTYGTYLGQPFGVGRTSPATGH